VSETRHLYSHAQDEEEEQKHLGRCARRGIVGELSWTGGFVVFGCGARVHAYGGNAKAKANDAQYNENFAERDFGEIGDGEEALEVEEREEV
jgi:hypothetical protein